MDDALNLGAWHIDPETRLKMRLEHVRAAMRDGAWREVILEAEELLDEDPSHPEALFLLGEALLEVADWVVAFEVYNHRVSLDGGDARSLVGLAIASYHLADIPRAIEAAREAIRLDPGNAEAHHVLGLALELTPQLTSSSATGEASRSNRIQEALAELTAASHLDPVQFPLPLVLKSAEWKDVIERARSGLPLKLQEFYRGVPVQLEDLPELAELRMTEPPLSPSRCALVRGAPPEEGDPFEIRPEAVRIYTRNLGRAGSVEAMVGELTFALREEALDWLGVELEDLEP